MDEALRRSLTDRLIKDYQFKRRGKWLSQGKCPSCGDSELYISADAPWILRCNRQNHCGYEDHVQDIYPELFANWSDRYPSTPENPNAAADAYMRDQRGFDLAKIRHWYSQEYFWSKDLGQGSATVRFTLPAGPNGERVAWERLIDRPERFGRQKANFVTPYGGHWWAPPSLDLKKVDEIWLAEGAFDAISLVHHDIPAVAILASGNYPALALAKLKAERGDDLPRLVWALDSDKAGQTAILKHVERSRKEGWEASAAQTGGSRDWNDCHKFEALEAKDIKKYRHKGALLLAETPIVAAKLIYEFRHRDSFPFAHQNRLYWFTFHSRRFQEQVALWEAGGNTLSEEKSKELFAQAIQVNQIANCVPTALYYLKNEVTSESWYYFRVDFPRGKKSVKDSFTSPQISSSSEFKTRLLGIGGGAYWSGNSAQFDHLLEYHWLERIKTVETIDFIGYSAKHGCYVFDKIAAKDGRLVPVNKDDYFDVSRTQAIKSLNRSLTLHIDTSGNAGPDWLGLLTTCYGPRGHIALAYWLGTLFAEQIRSSYESFPFLEIIGEPGSGKSTLITTLWKLFGRAGYEGFDPKKGSSIGTLRAMSQVSNLPVVLIESDRESADGGLGRVRSAFQWDDFKSLYNGGSLRTTGVKNSGNDTYDPQFRGALVIAQNNPVAASQPILERIIRLEFDLSLQSDAGREGGLALGRMKAEEISGFIVKAITHEKQILALFEQKMRTYERVLQDRGLQNLRLQKNYAQLLTLIDALALVCPISLPQQEAARAMCMRLALIREQDIGVDPPIVAQFWDTFDYLEAHAQHARINHSNQPDHIAVNLNQFVQVAAEMRQPVPLLADLKTNLKSASKSRPFVAQRVVKNKEGDSGEKNWRCWIFKRPKTSRDMMEE